MPPEPPIDEEDYVSSEDSDFAPEDAPGHTSSSGESDDEAAAGDKTAASVATTKKQEKGARAGAGAPSQAEDAEDADFENSGDEAVIGKGRKKRRRRDSDAEGDGGVGGFVKTRSQRANEKAERRAAAVRGPVTVDVDALWAQMTAAPGPAAGADADEGMDADAPRDDTHAAAADASTSLSTSAAAADDDTIKIRRTYNFAGQVHTEEKVVARDSAEAKLYLASLASGDKGADTATAAAAGGDDDDDDMPKRPPPRRAFRSAFEPEPPALPAGAQAHGRTDLDLGLQARLQARARAAHDPARTLNTVEKSRMDWAGFVDKEGIQDELALAGRAKGSFADRQLFLARSEARRDDEARRARLASKA